MPKEDLMIYNVFYGDGYEDVIFLGTVFHISDSWELIEKSHWYHPYSLEEGESLHWVGVNEPNWKYRKEGEIPCALYMVTTEEYDPEHFHTGPYFSVEPYVVKELGRHIETKKEAKKVKIFNAYFTGGDNEDYLGSSLSLQGARKIIEKSYEYENCVYWDYQEGGTAAPVWEEKEVPSWVYQPEDGEKIALLIVNSKEFDEEGQSMEHFFTIEPCIVEDDV